METNKLQKKKYTPSKEELKNAIIEKMRALELWEDRLETQIPPYWDSFSNFIIFNAKYFTDEQWTKAGESLWEHVSNLFSGKSIALQGRIKNDNFRSPNARVVYGPSSWVEFLDNRIWYTWNVEFTMFCSGNVTERHRIANFNCREEIVVDMFAGIGYFTLPYLVHAKAKHVFACEWNPKSVEALLLNLEKNKMTDKCSVLQGDVSDKGPKGVADRINLGLIPSCEKYWPKAAEILKPSGGYMHVHGNVSSLPSAQNPISPCKQCLNLLQLISTDSLEPPNASCLGGFVIKSPSGTDFEIMLKSEEIYKIKWKKIEWFVWSVHVCHSFCSLLTLLTHSVWNVEPTFLHRVKAYAPHIDHLVLDIYCENSMLCLDPQQSKVLTTT